MLFTVEIAGNKLKHGTYGNNNCMCVYIVYLANENIDISSEKHNSIMEVEPNTSAKGRYDTNIID